MNCMNCEERRQDFLVAIRQRDEARSRLVEAVGLLEDAAHVFEVASCDGTVLAPDVANQLVLRAIRVRAFLVSPGSAAPAGTAPVIGVTEDSLASRSEVLTRAEQAWINAHPEILRLLRECRLAARHIDTAGDLAGTDQADMLACYASNVLQGSLSLIRELRRSLAPRTRRGEGR